MEHASTMHHPDLFRRERAKLQEQYNALDTARDVLLDQARKMKDEMDAIARKRSALAGLLSAYGLPVQASGNGTDDDDLFPDE